MSQAQTRQAAPVIIGIGASAGGVEALQTFFAAAPGSPDAGYLVVLHMQKSRPSKLAEIIARETSLPVVHAEDGMTVEPGRIHVIEPGCVITVSRGRVVVTAAPDNERSPSTIDRLFNSLAQDYGECAIGVVLSGSGADGALGLKAIKERGGLTFAQGSDGSAPLFPEMPESALAAGVIDVHLPVEQIAQRLTSVVAAMLRHAGRSETADESADRWRKEICALLEAQLGHDFSGYKRSTFLRRVERRMYVLQLTSLQAYVVCLRKTPAEVTLLFRDLLISVTSFFRDTESFELLATQVIPELFSGKKKTDVVRVWVPGCATGEEAYSIGILLLEHADSLGASAPELRVFATDIDEEALGIARKARYPGVLLDGMPPAWREKFFLHDQDHYLVHRRLREICTFSAHNALRDPPFSRIDLVSCRNLLIYLGQAFQDRILPILHYALRPNGFLFVGVAEGATRHSQLFSPISKKHRVFRRLDAATGGPPLPLMTGGARHSGHRFTADLPGPSSGSLRKQIESRVLQSYMPAYVLVNAQGEAVFYSAGTGAYLEFSAGAPSRHLLSNARKELRLGLRRALHEAISNHVLVTLPESIVPRDDGPRRVQVQVEPFDGGPTPMYLVVFMDHGAAPVPGSSSEGSSHSADDLERELRDTRDQLQTTYEEFETAIEELRVANEELMSMNEELQSSNEELETSKEELQSVNEELQTVNGEMGRHVEALDQANADLQGLIESTGIATIFLDSNLAIRSFTRAAADVFTLIPSDRGRLITDLAHQLTDFDLEKNLKATLIERAALQFSTTRRDGRKHYLTCLLPYSASSDEPAGVVMTFVDVTAMTNADARHQVMIGELNHRVRNMLAVVTAIASQTLRDTTSPEGLEQFLNRLHAMARTYKLLTEANWSNMSLSDLLREELGAVAGTNRFELEGARIELSPKYSLAMGMVFHELAINALKYGGLANERGQVLVRWNIDSARKVTIHWVESGGLPVSEPSHRGFGSSLMDHQLAYELDARCVRSFHPDGLEVVIEFVLEGSPP
jgi:two-component system, chemotaxis family, CheB/CheR fusion protein